MKYTKNNLLQELEVINEWLAHSLSPYYLQHGARNGYQAVDIYYIKPNGVRSCSGNLECGTIQECALAAHKYSIAYHGYKYPQKRLTREQAKVMLESIGVDFTRDFHESALRSRTLMLDLAKETKYYRPKNANGSRVRYFFQNLAKIN